MGYKLLQTQEVINAGRRLKSLPGGQNYGLKSFDLRHKYKNWRDVPGDYSGTLIFFKKECPSCWIKNKQSYLILVHYNREPIFTCLNCRFDTSDIN